MRQGCSVRWSPQNLKKTQHWIMTVRAGSVGTGPEDGAALRAELAELNSALKEQKARVRDLWQLNCQQLVEMDNSLVKKDKEIMQL